MTGRRFDTSLVDGARGSIGTAREVIPIPRPGSTLPGHGSSGERQVGTPYIERSRDRTVHLTDPGFIKDPDSDGIDIGPGKSEVQPSPAS